MSRALRSGEMRRLAKGLVLPGGTFAGGARIAFVEGDASRLLSMYSNDQSLEIVLDNVDALRRRGIYEEALADALTIPRVNHCSVPMSVLRMLLEIADPKRLLAAGDAIPDGDSFTLYRGVASRGRRKVAGPFWTSSLETAAFFAMRFRLLDPAVYRASVRRAKILYYSNSREEQEFLAFAKSPKRLEFSDVELRELAARRRKGVA